VAAAPTAGGTKAMPGQAGSDQDTPHDTPAPAATCAVPDMVGLSSGGPANQAWHAAGFIPGTIDKHEAGTFVIASQSLSAGTTQPCSAKITVHDHR
jgi:hypothetical protein